MRYLNVKKALAAWMALQPLSEKDRERWQWPHSSTDGEFHPDSYLSKYKVFFI